MLHFFLKKEGLFGFVEFSIVSEKNMWHVEHGALSGSNKWDW